jgi:ribosomal protein S18 acetylase RimI-like enzyme
MSRATVLKPVDKPAASPDAAPAPYRIRAAEAYDLNNISALEGRITGQPKPSYWRDMLRSYGDGPGDRYFLLAEDEAGTLLGFVLGEVRAWEFGSPPAGWVFAINVDPDTRQGGIGTALFEAICQRFRQAGVRSVRTMVDRRDHLILSFFRSQGLMAGPSIELEMELP